MLTLYKSSQLDVLFNAWSGLIRQPAPGGPLRPRTVIVPNMDMAQWLQVHQAEQAGISANINFQLPAGYFREIFESQSDRARTHLLDKHLLRWMAFSLLGEALESGRHPREWDVLLDWIRSAAQKVEGSRDLKGIRWDLAGQIADVYDQYIVYRPEWLRSWVQLSGGGPDAGLKFLTIAGLEGMNAWQPSFWDAICGRWGDYPNRADMMLSLVDGLCRGEVSGYGLPSQIFVFGINSMAPILMEALLLISKYADVYWFQRDNEAADLFQDDFFAELSVDQRDQSGLMEDLIARHGIEVQTRVLDEAPGISAIPASISVHRCHSPRREAEVLYDALLHLFETRDIRPGDVAVVTPDVDLYAPFVHEVFYGGDKDRPQIPIRVSGGQLSGRELIADVLLRALDLANSRFKATELLDWLGLAPVLGDFMDETGLRGTLNRWIEEQMIRWGSSPEHIRDIGFEMDGRHSWMFGLQRLLLARIASEDQEVTYAGRLSGSAVTTKDEGILLGRLVSLISALEQFHSMGKSAKTMAEWGDLIGDLLETIIIRSDWLEKCDRIRSALRDMLNLESGLVNETISLEIVRDYLKTRLEPGGLGRAWHPGQVTFTGMVALHQFPYKVVAMIGLNDGSLPGRTPVTVFDLLSRNHQPGDRVRRQADRQMFLDYLITTRDILHISYTGFRQTDNKQLAPSVMITALMDAMKRWNRMRGIDAPDEIQHRLQPFHARYFEGSDATKSYSKRNLQIAEMLQNEKKDRNTIVPEVSPEYVPGFPEESDHAFQLTDGKLAISLAQILEFYNDPVKYVLRNGYGIDLFESEVPDQDFEPFDLNGLDKWKIRNEIWTSFIKELRTGPLTEDTRLQRIQQLASRLQLEGILPDAIAGRKSFESAAQEISEAWDSVRLDAELDLTRPLVERPVSGDITLPGKVDVRVDGVVDVTANGIYFALEPGSKKIKKILRHWICHVMLNMESSTRTRIYFKGEKPLEFAGLSKEEANLRMHNLLWVLLYGSKNLVPVFPECSDLYLKSAEPGDPGTMRQAIHRIINATSGEEQEFSSGAFKEIASVWVNQAWAGRHPVLTSLLHSNMGPSIPANTKDRVLSLRDFKDYDAFSVVSVKIFGLMKEDLP